MNKSNTDTEWEKWGKNDPYFGVITSEKYRNQNLTEETKNEFFESGKKDIDFVLHLCRRHLDQYFSPKRILDFGCGVGRLVIPFSEIAEQVVGIDISDSMLKEARKNCEDRSIQNVILLKSDDDLSLLDGEFDLIHSVIVFQHIPVVRGKHIFANLLKHLKTGGIGVIQITYSKTSYGENDGLPLAQSSILTFRKNIRRRARALMKRVKRLFRRQTINDLPSKDPEMQMNPYNVNELLFYLQSTGVHTMYTRFTDHGGELGLFLYFQKTE